MILSRDATPKIDGRLARVVSAAQRRCAGSGPMLAMLLAAAYVYFLRQPTVLRPRRSGRSLPDYATMPTQAASHTAIPNSATGTAARRLTVAPSPTLAAPRNGNA